MTPTQSQLQADLQRKHAELQVIIGQQQAELRKVSEQLLMAKLGLLPSTQAQSSESVSTPAISTTEIDLLLFMICDFPISFFTWSVKIHIYKLRLKFYFISLI